MASENVVPFPDWKTKLARRKNGEPYADERNVLAALELAPELSRMLRYDVFADRIEFAAAPPWTDRIGMGTAWADDHRVALQVWLQAQGLNVTRASVVQDVVIAHAKRHSYHPLQQKLSALEWDGVDRISTWLSVYLGACDGENYLKAVGRAFLVSAVARVFIPGEKVDTVLVLEGPQGLGKSRAIGILNYGYGTDYLPDMHKVDAAIQIQGTWINELSELSSYTRSEVEAVKAFLSRTIDKYRPPYGRNTIERKRQCVFVGSTNLTEYLTDETGGRRLWPVRCRNINLAALERDVDQLWAEAIQAWANAEPWHLTRELEPVAFVQQELRRFVTEEESRLLEYLDQALKDGKREVMMGDILHDVAGIDDLRIDGRAAGGIAKRLSRILTAARWERQPQRGRGTTRRQPYKYSGLPSQAAQAETENVLVMSDVQAAQAAQAETENFDDVPF